MKSRDVRNLILTLAILALGIKIITYISGRFITQAGTAGFSGLVGAFTGLGDLMVYGLAAIALLLIPFYFSKRSSEKAV